MGKIDEFEQKIIKNGLTEEDLKEYEKLLRQVNDNFLKRQHCYTTAVKFPVEYAQQAVTLIQYGLESFEDGWFSTYTSYLHIGSIYEKATDYQKAYESYLLAKNALGTDQPAYTKQISKNLFWMKLHIDSFCYSAEMENYYLSYTQAEEFSKAFVNNEFRLAVANIVIALHYKRTDEAKQSLETAKKICKPNYTGKLHNILIRHKYYETLNTTPQSVEFINSLKI